VKAIEKQFNIFTQFAIPILVILSMTLVSFKLPQWGLIVNLAVQPFYLYSTWKSYKKAGQIGLLVTTIIMTIVLSFGIINYWIFR
jgi:hypothetical protein